MLQWFLRITWIQKHMTFMFSGLVKPSSCPMHRFRITFLRSPFLTISMGGNAIKALFWMEFWYNIIKAQENGWHNVWVGSGRTLYVRTVLLRDLAGASEQKPQVGNFKLCRPRRSREMLATQPLQMTTTWSWLHNMFWILKAVVDRNYSMMANRFLGIPLSPMVRTQGCEAITPSRNPQTFSNWIYTGVLAVGCPLHNWNLNNIWGESRRPVRIFHIGPCISHRYRHRKLTLVQLLIVHIPCWNIPVSVSRNCHLWLFRFLDSVLVLETVQCDDCYGIIWSLYIDEPQGTIQEREDCLFQVFSVRQWFLVFGRLLWEFILSCSFLYLFNLLSSVLLAEFDLLNEEVNIPQ